VVLNPLEAAKAAQVGLTGDSPKTQIKDAETISYSEAAVVTSSKLSAHQIRRIAKKGENGIVIQANGSMVKTSFTAWWTNNASRYADGTLPPDTETNEEVERKLAAAESQLKRRRKV
jgi:L-aminopeptidase/D-esterase-like protein